MTDTDDVEELKEALRQRDQMVVACGKALTEQEHVADQLRCSLQEQSVHTQSLEQRIETLQSMHTVAHDRLSTLQAEHEALLSKLRKQAPSLLRSEQLVPGSADLIRIGEMCEFFPSSGLSPRTVAPRSPQVRMAAPNFSALASQYHPGAATANSEALARTAYLSQWQRPAWSPDASSTTIRLPGLRAPLAPPSLVLSPRPPTPRNSQGVAMSREAAHAATRLRGILHMELA